MATTYDDKQLKDLYAKNLAAQTEQIEADYLEADKKINEEKLKAQKLTDENLNRTAVEAQKAAINQAELHNAYGLSSGARAQARLASENQTRSDMATLRQQLQDTEAAAERERTLLSDQYASAIRQAQQQNDLALAQALYDAAQKEEERINTQKLNDTNWERQQELNKIEAEEKDLERKMQAALVIAEETGDYSLYAQLAGLTNEDVVVPEPKPGTTGLSEEAKMFLKGLPTSNGLNTAWRKEVYQKLNTAYNNGEISTSAVKEIMNQLGMDETWR